MPCPTCNCLCSKSLSSNIFKRSTQLVELQHLHILSSVPIFLALNVSSITDSVFIIPERLWNSCSSFDISRFSPFFFFPAFDFDGEPFGDFVFDGDDFDLDGEDRGDFDLDFAFDGDFLIRTLCCFFWNEIISFVCFFV